MSSQRSIAPAFGGLEATVLSTLARLTVECTSVGADVCMADARMLDRVVEESPAAPDAKDSWPASLSDPQFSLYSLPDKGL